jgi:hypothetical protein
MTNAIRRDPKPIVITLPIGSTAKKMANKIRPVDATNINATR